MARPILPNLLTIPKIPSYTFDEPYKTNIARTLGLNPLPDEIYNLIRGAIECYKATAEGSKSTTVGNIKFALKELNKTGIQYNEALELFINNRSGADYTTFNLLHPLALAALHGGENEKQALIRAANDRITELGNLRVETEKEPLRMFCGRLREIFNYAAAHKVRTNDKHAWKSCISFTKEVFTAAKIKERDFESHSHRLKKYLGTDISTN